MAPISFEPEIYTYNIDFGQHVSNIAYIQWMEIGRLKLLEATGLSVHEIQERGIAPILRHTEITYSKPLYLGDKVRVEMWISELKKISATMRFRFIRLPDEVVAKGKQEGLFFSLETKKPYKLPHEERLCFSEFTENDK